MSGMEYRRLGRTDHRISEIGFGACGIDKSVWIGAEDNGSLHALHPAADLGVNFIDTTLAYGNRAWAGPITPSSTFPRGDWRNCYFRGESKRQASQRVEHLRFLLHDGVDSLAEAALRFCLSHRAVSAVIPGMRTVEHVEANCRLGDGRPLPADESMALRTHVWPHDYYH